MPIFSITSAMTAQPMRLSQALPSRVLPSPITANSAYGVTGQPSKTPKLRAMSSSTAPISIYISRLATTFVRSSGVSICGGLLPITPTRSPLLPCTVTRWLSITCSHQPPKQVNFKKPSFVICLTIKPISSIWLASIIFGKSLP